MCVFRRQQMCTSKMENMRRILLYVITLSTFLKANSQLLATDSFNNGTINSHWFFISPNPDSRYALNDSGELLIKASAKNGGSDLCCGNFNAPRLMQRIDTANHRWRVETKIRFNPTFSYQAAGILFQASNDSTEGGSAVLRIIDRFIYPNSFGSQGIGSLDGSVAYTDTITYLRAERNIDSIRVYYSKDGTNWVHLSSIVDRPIFFAGLNASRVAYEGGTSLDTYAYFDYFKVDYNSTLPLHLTSFTTTKIDQTIQLNWTTTQEVNTDHFEVERSENGSQFNTIATLSASSNETVKSYSIVDKSPKALSVMFS
jgi:hypothetical protein